MKRFVLLFIAFSMLFISACASVETSSETGFRLYYRTADNGSSSDRIIGSRPLDNSIADINLENVMESLFSGPGSDSGLISPFPEGLSLLFWELDGGNALLTLSREYSQLEGIDRTIADACITMTLLQFENIIGAAIRIGSDGEFSGVMNGSSFELLERNGSASERVITLYFAMADNDYLAAERQTLVAAQSDSVERYVIEELLKGPKSGKLKSAVPEGTGLRSITTEKGICYVDLSSDFLERYPNDARNELLAVYSIVNSLTSLSNIKKVQILVEGETCGKKLNLNLDMPLGANKYLNYPDKEAYAFTEVTIYVRRRDENYVSPLEILYKPAEYSGEVQTITEALMDFEPPIGYEPLFAGGAELLSIAVRSDVCYVSFSEGFLNASSEQLRFCVYALTASLTATENVNSVQVLINGSVREDMTFDISQPFSLSDIEYGK
ncbi:MAG: GerMN domain-containing protein [Oscillospiraceae bacterium]|jgi:germination protein M